MLSLLLLSLFSCLAAIQAALLPSMDPFYIPPQGLELTPLGTVLRTRQILPISLSKIPFAVAGVQLLYRTRSINGTAVASVTTVLMPANASTSRFISFQFAEDSANVNCAPSYNIQQGSSETNPTASFEYSILSAYLGAGHVVSAPDYQGGDAAFAAGRLEAYGVLDSMRAVASYRGGMQSIVGVGYSGGAIATGWAASMHPSYAPDLNVKGWSMGGTPANLTATMYYLDNTDYSGVVLAALSGLDKPSSYQAQLGPLLSGIMTSYGQQLLDIASNYCVVSSLFTFANHSVLSYDFQTLGPGLMDQSNFTDVLFAQTMGAPNGVPTAPVYLYHAILDEIIPYKPAVALYHSWCNAGASVQFTTYPVSDHVGTEILGLSPSIRFVSAAFQGNTPKGCAVGPSTNYTLDPSALLADLSPLFNSRR